MTFKEYKEEALKDPDVKKAYDEQAPEYEIIKAMIDARYQLRLTQQALAERTGIPQARISKLETGQLNPRLDTLKKIADGIGKELHIEFRERTQKPV